MFERSFFGPRVRLKHLVPFLHQAGTMLRAGIGIRQTFDTLARSTSSRTLRRAIEQMSARVEAGDSLEEALEAAGPVFPEMMVRILVVGETTGGLDRMFLELADYFQWWRTTVRRCLTFLIWPCIIVFVLIHVIALLMFLRGGNWLGFLLYCYIVVLVLLFLPKILRTLFGKSTPLDHALLNAPVFGKHVRTLLLARFALALELMMEAGLGTHEALERAADATGNEAFKRGIRPAVARVLEGESFTESLARTGMFPQIFLARMQTAEESGALVEDLRRLARDYAEEARFAIELIMRMLVYGGYFAIILVVGYFVITFWLGYYNMIADLAGGR
jgi:type II secretory pathway component PulF